MKKLLLFLAAFVFAAAAFAAPECGAWEPEYDSSGRVVSYWHTCVGDDGVQYCERGYPSSDGRTITNISRVSCK